MYLTLPSFSWDACLKKTGVQIELIIDPEKHLLFENNIRGGISTISHHYARVNVPGTPTFDRKIDPSYLSYVDANNLNGWVMSEKLPTGDYKCLLPTKLRPSKLKIFRTILRRVTS